MASDASEKYQALLNDFNVAMFVTVDSDGKPRSRPMVIAAKYSDNEFGFVGTRDTDTVDALQGNPFINMSLQGNNAFMSICGTATVDADRAELERLWQPGWQAWFPNGKDDPKLVLIRLRAESAEYWDLTGLNQLRFLFEAGRAMLSNNSEANASPIHGKVDFS